MKWLEPKNDWNTDTPISYSDLNRIENNTKLLRDSLIYSIKGFNISVIGDSTTSADMQDCFTISSGGCITINDDGNIIPIKINSAFTKTIEAFSVGNENGSLCPGVALANDQWMYVFLLYNTELETFDYAIDDNSFGSHLSSIAGFNKSVLVSVFQINEIDTSVFKIHPIFSIGDRFYLYRGDHGTNYSTSDNNYRCAVIISGSVSEINGIYELKNLNGNYMLPIGIGTEFFGDAELKLSANSYPNSYEFSMISPLIFLGEQIMPLNSNTFKDIPSDEANFNKKTYDRILTYDSSVFLKARSTSGFTAISINMNIYIAGFFWDRGN